jgi:hypothetical protein
MPETTANGQMYQNASEKRLNIKESILKIGISSKRIKDYNRKD